MPVFDQDIIDILKNFETINPKILFEKGDVIRVISPSQNVLAKSKLPFEIPLECCIYDLRQLVRVLGMDPTRNVEFRDTYLEIIGQHTNVKYHYAEPEVIDANLIKTKSLDIKLPSCEASFKITYEVIKEALQYCTLLNQAQILFDFNEDSLYIKTYSSRTGNMNSFSHKLEMGNANTSEFKFILNKDVMNFYKEDYVVNISKSKFIEFVGDKVSYLIASIPEQTYVK